MTASEAGSSGTPPDEHDIARQIRESQALSRLIAAASAPPSSAELTGEAEALMAYRQAQPARAGQVGRLRLLPGSRGVKLVVAGGAATAVLAGTGIAAAAGGLLHPLQAAAHQLFPAPSPVVRPLKPSESTTAPGSQAATASAPGSPPASRSGSRSRSVDPPSSGAPTSGSQSNRSPSAAPSTGEGTGSPGPAVPMSSAEPDGSEPGGSQLGGAGSATLRPPLPSPTRSVSGSASASTAVTGGRSSSRSASSSATRTGRLSGTRPPSASPPGLRGAAAGGQPPGLAAKKALPPKRAPGAEATFSPSEHGRAHKK